MKLNNKLETFWITFPKDQNMPFGIGVTAESESEAFDLIEEQGINEWFEGAKEIKVETGVRIDDLDQANVRPNIGPMQFRGVWYPSVNTGFGAPKDAYYARFSDDDA